MAGITALGYINYFKTGALTADSYEASMGPTNLSSDRCSPSTGWQTADGVLAAVLTCTAADAASTWRGFALVNTNLTSAASVVIKLFFTGAPSVAIYTTTVAGPEVGYRQIVAIATSDKIADYVEFHISDLANPDNHLNIGGAFAGPLWIPNSGLAADSSYGRNVQRTDTRARGGERYINPLYQERRWRISLNAVRDTEAWDDLGEMERVAALGTNVLAVPNISSAGLYREVVFGVLENVADTTFPHSTTDARAWAGQVTERL